MFFYTDTPEAPWTVVKTNDKKRARLESMRYLLSRFDYADKDRRAVGEPDAKIVGSASQVYEQGEDVTRQFPQL